jgi:hypothetical protein
MEQGLNLNSRWVDSFKLLLILASTVILGSGTSGHITIFFCITNMGVAKQLPTLIEPEITERNKIILSIESRFPGRDLNQVPTV